jgi:hypothetical protein
LSSDSDSLSSDSDMLFFQKTIIVTATPIQFPLDCNVKIIKSIRGFVSFGQKPHKLDGKPPLARR